MCVDSSRSALFSRGAFLAAASTTVLPLFTEPARALDRVTGTSGSSPGLTVPQGLTQANRRAAEIAARSPFVRAQYGAVAALGKSIADARLRTDIDALLRDPQPRYAAKYPTAESRAALRDALLAQGALKSGTPLEAVFPLPFDGKALPFWAAPGSAADSHHAYPGGLAVHELFNATMASQFAQTYDRVYFSNRNAVDRDTVVAAALYHDIMKTIVFQYNADGSFFKEAQIAGTGAHHCLSGAEAIVRGRDASFVTVLLSAHAAPSLGDEKSVVRWCRASATIAGVDPVEYGLLVKNGDDYRLAQLPAMEAFVNHLSDHDFVLSVHAAHEVIPRVDAVAPKYGASAPDDVRWWRLATLSHSSIIALYHELTRGEAQFERAVATTARTLHG